MSHPTALITGGTTGIGRAAAELLRERGHRVVVTGRDPVTLEAARHELPDDVVVLRADARSPADTDRLVEEVRERFGTLDVLLLNAGITRSMPFAEVDEAAYDEVFDVNTKGQLLTLGKLLPLLADGASVLFTVGAGVRTGIPGGALAAASRGALLSAVPSLALELAPRRIRVNAISPGLVDTPIWAKNGLPPGALAGYAGRVPLGRVGTAREVAEAVGYLVGAGYVTGQELVVAGGSGLGA
ncbi:MULTISPECIES: SDR family oxidoreductase [Actinosynnema]|uniref:SDR family oxidoreductase n=1 Tax=Actinosynnema TaxID=40566 RepID=UPI0020A3D6EB|nr:SDR family oxidoreductase [Actinosynnema pretiosum]MCP2096577.1 NAD(P)-dependent dehydrogenase, short-chain alcohol dehydrogenase family [Actinosynnema pretiosum]